MLSFFKRKITFVELGGVIIQISSETLGSDADRSLGMMFDDFDASNGWTSFLRSKDITPSIQGLYYRLYIHCAVQGVCTQFDTNKSFHITQGAMNSFKVEDLGYDFSENFNALNALYRGNYKLSEMVNSLENPICAIRFLPNVNIGVLNSKYLMQKFVIPKMKNPDLFADKFELYSTIVSVALGTVQRAIDYTLRSVKI